MKNKTISKGNNLKNNFELIPNAIEEMLRFEPPVHATVRFAQKDMIYADKKYKIPIFEDEKIKVNNFEGVKSAVGNPHFMIEVEDVDGLDLENLNTEVLNKNIFPDGVNVEIYQIISRNYIKARVYERGVGETDACGSGALCIFNYLSKTDQIDNLSLIHI